MVGGRILKANQRLIGNEMKKNKLKHAVGAIRPLEAVLRRQVFTVYLSENWFAQYNIVLVYLLYVFIKHALLCR